MTMKTTILLFVSLGTFLLGSSFTTDKPIPYFVGTYGVSPSDPSHILLTIHADHTFSYQDFSIPNEKISVEGQWSARGEKIVLVATGSAMKYHHVWSFDEKGQVAKSRSGLSYYRLQRIGG
jgi:hypothetical protein